MNFKNVDRLYEYKKLQLGLERTQVRLGAGHTKWKRAFSDEAYFVFDQLREESLRLFHVGSTSIPGILAKPIIDVLGSVKSLAELDQKKSIFESIGYEYKGEYGIDGRRYCVLYNPEKTEAFVHLHIFEHSHPEVTKHLQFRDYLRSNSSSAKEYENFKVDLIHNKKIERSLYSAAKTELILKFQNAAVSAKPTQQKILIVVGSSEGHQNTKKYSLDCFSNQNHEVVDLFESGLQAYSYKKVPDDVFFRTVEKIIQADLTVLATPVYWYSMSGVMKDFLDRFSNLMSGPNKNLGESLYGKKVMLLATGSDLKLPMGFEVPFVSTAIYFGMDYLGAQYRSSQESTK
jgi:GrpB-like predicted nucleotidyltransferase (UPF0157 family)